MAKVEKTMTNIMDNNSATPDRVMCPSFFVDIMLAPARKAPHFAGLNNFYVLIKV
jgi:hypothetical protein